MARPRRKRQIASPRYLEAARHFLAGKSKRAAAIAAGFSRNNASKTALVIFEHPDIKAMVEKANKKITDKALAKGLDERELALAELDERIRDASAANQHSAVASMLQTKNKIKGLMIEKHQVSQASFSVIIERQATPPPTNEPMLAIERSTSDEEE